MASKNDQSNELATTDEGTVVLCPHCLAHNEVARHFCRQCATPLTAHAEIDPLGRVYAMGDTYRKAIGNPKNTTFVVGICVLFGLSGLMALFALIGAALERVSSTGYRWRAEEAFMMPVGFLWSMAQVWISGTVLFRLTKSGRRWWDRQVNAVPSGFEVVMPAATSEIPANTSLIPSADTHQNVEPDAGWEALRRGEIEDVRSLLVSEESLAALDGKIEGQINSLSEMDPIDPHDATYGTAYRRYLLFSRWPELVEEGLNDLAIFCNTYYWFLRFSSNFQETRGPDKTLEEEGFAMIEQADVEMPWWVVEQLEERARNDDERAKGIAPRALRHEGIK